MLHAEQGMSKRAQGWQRCDECARSTRGMQSRLSSGDNTQGRDAEAGGRAMQSGIRRRRKRGGERRNWGGVQGRRRMEVRCALHVDIAIVIVIVLARCVFEHLQHREQRGGRSERLKQRMGRAAHRTHRSASDVSDRRKVGSGPQQG